MNLNAREETATPASRPGLSGAKSRLSRLLTDPVRTLCGIYATFGRKSLIAERDALIVQRNDLMLERDALVQERNRLIRERNGLMRERDGLMRETLRLRRAPGPSASFEVKQQLQRLSSFEAFRGEPALSDEKVLSHIRKKIEYSTIKMDPFPHLVVGEVFPSSVYLRMSEDLPSSEQWEAAAREETVRSLVKAGTDEENARRDVEFLEGGEIVQPQFSLRDAVGTSHSLEAYSDIWARKYSRFVEYARQLVYAKYKPPIDLYLKFLQSAALLDIFPKLIPASQTLFCHRTLGWDIPPHTHDYKQLIHIMFYYPLPGSTNMEGTVLYRPKKAISKTFSVFAATCEFTDYEVEVVECLPYEPNTLVSFLNTPKSIHSSPYIEGPPRQYIFTGLNADYRPPEKNEGNVIDLASLRI